MKYLAIAVITAALSLPASAAHAQYKCFQLEALTKSLKAKFGEVPVATYIANGGLRHNIVFVSPDGTSTLVGVSSNNRDVGCIMDAGDNWSWAKEGIPQKLRDRLLKSGTPA